MKTLLPLAVASLLLATTARADLDDGLILYYSFDRDEGARVTDASGAGRHAQVKGPRWIAEGVRGGAYSFERQGDLIETSDAGLPAGDAPRSVSWWFSLDSLRPSPLSTDIISYGVRSWGQFFALSVDWRIGRDCLAQSPWGWVFLSNRRIERAGVWHHAVLTYAGNGRFAYYLDGELCRGFNEVPTPIDTRLGGRFLIGRYSPEIHGLDGRIDEVRVYDRALSAEEAQALHRQAEASRVAANPPNAPDGAAPLRDGAPATTAALDPNERVEREAGDAPGRAGTPAGATEAAYLVTRISFSNQEDGESDVTLFYPEEQLHVAVTDVDLRAADTNLQIRVSVYQRSDREGQADVTALLEPQTDGSFRAALPLTSLRPGPAQVDLAGYDLAGRVLRLFRTSTIRIADEAPAGP